MAVLRDKEEEKGQGTSQALGQQVPGQAQPQEETQPQQPQTSAPATIGSSSATQTSAPVKAMPKQQKAGTGTFSNLRTYLQAAQGGGQQKVAQAATQQVQRLGTGAQKGIQQAQETFGRQMQAGSLAGMETAGQEAADIVKAARQATYQAPQAEGATAAQTPAPAQPQVQPQQYFTPEQQQRFADIINAQYQGPASLQQAGLYEQAAKKARTAQQAAELTQTAGGREQLLRDVFGRGRDYSRGASRLDALLLNASEQGVQQLQQQAQPALQAQQALQAAQNLSANEAAQRTAAIEQIRSGARTAFTEARTAEEQATEKRIDDLIKTPARDESGNLIQKLDSTGKPVVDTAGNPVYQTEWDRLPEYFRQSLANKSQNTQKIQQEQLTALKQQYKPQIDQVNSISAQRDALQRELNNNIISAGISKSIRGETTPGLEDTIKAQQNQLQALSTQLSDIQNSPEYQTYQNQLMATQSMNPNQWILSPEEAAVLGIGAGEGLYNIRPEDIKTAQAERARLITKNELARQQALAQLAERDIARELQKQLLYTDMEKAGTQDLRSSLDVEAFRRLLDESQRGFGEAAEAATLTGTGRKKVSRGNWAGKKTKTYYANVEGNVADMLRQAGYDVGAEGVEGVKSLLTDKDLLNRYLGATSTSRDTEANIGGSALEGTGAGAATGASIGTAINPGLGTGVGAAVGATVGGMAGANTLDQIQYYTDLAKEMEEKLGIKGLGAAGQAVQDVRQGAGSIFKGAGNIAGSNVLGDVFRGIGGAIGGIDTGAMKAYGEAIAKEGAIADLKNKYAQWLAGQGFENRANIASTETTQARTAALLDLLRRQS